jgi:hypothetical protein
MENNMIDHPGSFRDPSGSVFFYEGQLYRKINICYREDYEAVTTTGLYDRLVREELLLPHEEVPLLFDNDPNIFKIIRPEFLPFISYPYEWCFSQLKDAALATLNIQKIALNHGCILKDASAYNVQFKDGRPILIDTLSFKRYVEGEPWVAYRQFCQHFMAPLALMSRTDIRLSQLTRIFLDGLPLDFARNLLPWKTYFHLFLLLHIHLHARVQKRFSKKFSVKSYSVRKPKLQAIVDSLLASVNHLKWNPRETEWAEYDREMNYQGRSFESKKALVSQILQQIRPEVVWDLGANVGTFSRIASAQKVPVISLDADPGAVEKNYLWCKANGECHILPLVIDMTNPSPAIGWENTERASLIERGPADLVMALALIHHLAISNNLPLLKIAQFFSTLCRRWLIVEYVPKNDTWAQYLLGTRTDSFADYTQDHFERAFAPFFDIRFRKKIEDSERFFYFLEKKESR